MQQWSTEKKSTFTVRNNLAVGQADHVITLTYKSSVFVFLIEGSTYGPAKIAKPTVFQVVLQGIGKSFQSAITAHRINLTGYGNATAQS